MILIFGLNFKKKKKEFCGNWSFLMVAILAIKLKFQNKKLAKEQLKKYIGPGGPLIEAIGLVRGLSSC